MIRSGPTFMCIGAQKAGTTWLYTNLYLHPDTAMPPLKEIHYFDEIYRKEKTGLVARLAAQEGMNKWWWKEKIYSSFRIAIKSKRIRDIYWFIKYFFYPRNLKWYDHLFFAPGNKISGDITPDYCILDKGVIGMIHDHYPDLKIIYLIRNPVDRAWSALKMRYVQRRNMAVSDIDENLVEDYYEEFYAFNDVKRTILKWTTYFPPEQFFIGFYDELVNYPQTLFNNILEYLELNKICGNMKINQKIFKGISGKMPAKIYVLLNQKSIEQIRFLNTFIEGPQAIYPAKWLQDAEEILSSL